MQKMASITLQFRQGRCVVVCVDNASSVGEVPDVCNIYLMRHGQTFCNVVRRVHASWFDRKYVELTYDGCLQACKGFRALQRNEVRVAKFYASPMLRAEQTARAVHQLYCKYASHGQQCDPKVKYDDRLEEIGMGDSAGMSFDDKAKTYGPERERLDKEYTVLAERWERVAVPGAESVANLQSRFFASLQEIGERHINENVFVVTHGKAMAAFLAKIYDQPETNYVIDNGQIVHAQMVRYPDQAPQFVVLNHDWSESIRKRHYFDPPEKSRVARILARPLSSTCTLV